MPTTFSYTAEHDGRYSEGSYATFSESYVFYTLSKHKTRSDIDGSRVLIWVEVVLSLAQHKH
jgi:hypothetical protein